MLLTCPISFRVFCEKGDLPSKEWRTIPSSKSPKLISFSSATAFNTLRRRFSTRMPVWTRSTGSASLRFFMRTNVLQYNVSAQGRKTGEHVDRTWTWLFQEQVVTE